MQLTVDRRLLHYFDWGLFSLSVIIPLCGLVVLYSAGYDADSSGSLFGWIAEIKSPAFVKQVFFILGGLVVLTIGLLFSPTVLLRYSYLLYAACIVSLILVDIFGVVSNGSQRWFSFGPLKFQPAEVMKLGLILAMARYLSKNPPKPGGYTLKQLIIPGGMFLLPMALIVDQPDLGTALVVGAVGFLMILFVGIRVKTLALMALIGIIAVVPAWNKLHDYQKRRVMVLFNPEMDPRGSGYHINQSKIAVGSGAMLGKGFMKGTQTQLEFLPEHTTDFIFSVLAEEWGFLGCSFILALYLLFLYRILRVVLKSRDLFSAMVVFGVASLIFFHVVVNVGMVVGILPVVGIPLPLFSYGGSSIVATMFSLGIVLGLSMRRLLFVTGS